MAGSTPNLGLYLPGGGSTGTWTPDEVADIDPINQNFQKLDQFAGTVGVQTSRNQQYYGPAGSISSVTGMKKGDEYQESDGNGVLWRYDGTNWTAGESGMVLLRPTTANLVNATVNPDGSITPTTAQTTFSVNNIFSARFRKYRIDYYAKMNANTNMFLQLRVGGVSNVSATYNQTYMEGSGTTVAFGTLSTATSWQITGKDGAQNHWGHCELTNPATGGTDQLKTQVSQGNGAIGGAASQATRSGYLPGVDATVYDGFTILTQSAAQFLLPVTSFKVYGLT